MATLNYNDPSSISTLARFGRGKGEGKTSYPTSLYETALSRRTL
jgi:hypothetical protein